MNAYRPLLVLLAHFVFVVASASASEAEIRSAVEGLAGPGIRVESVRPAGFLGLYEVLVDGQLLYTDARRGYVVVGRVIDESAKNRGLRPRKEAIRVLAA